MARCRIGNRGADHVDNSSPICLCRQASLVEHIVHIDGTPESSAPSGRCSEAEAHWARERRKRQRGEATIAKLTEQA